MEIRPGDVLSHFKVLEKVGEGGMGVVFRAHDLHLERDVALKVLSNRAASGEESERRFRKEALALSRLNHPNIASIYDFDRSDGISFLVMEWIPGSTLDHRLADGPLPERTLLEYGEQISMALASAHSEGIIHRDLKPGNLGLGADGRIKVLDFGLAKLWKPASDSSLTQTLPRLSALVGTIPYIAPEVFTGAPASVASDIYSLGAVLYELATARRAFPQSDSDALTAAIMHKPPEPPRAVNPKISPDLERVILRCLEKLPNDRYASAFDVRSDLRRIAEGLPIVSVRRRRIPQRFVRVGAVAVLAGAAVVLSVVSGGRPPRPSAFMKALATSPANEWSPRISPDKEWISYLSDAGDAETIWLQRVKGGDPRPLVSEAGILSPIWSPDGERIAFLVIRLDQPMLRIVPAFGGGADATFRLAPDFMNANLVRWVGSSIYAEIRGSGLVRIDAANGGVDRLLPSQSRQGLRSYFDVRGDEKETVWSLHRGSSTTVWTSALDGSGAEQRTFGSHNDFAPRYATDSAIFCSSDRSGQADIWRMALDSGAAEQITFSPNVEYVADVARDESLLLFTEYREGSQLWRWNRRTGEHRQLTADALRHLFPSYSAAAGRLVVQREKPVMEHQRGLFNAEVLVSTMPSGRLNGSWTHVGDGGGARLSPDGMRVAFIRPAGDDLELVVRDLRLARDWSVTRTFKRSRYYPFPRDWDRQNVVFTPDSGAVVFVQTPAGGGDQIAMWSADGSVKPVYTTAAGLSIGDLHPAADGRLAFVTSSSQGTSESMIHILAGTNDTIVYAKRHERIGKVLLRGWLTADSLLAIETTWNDDWTERASILTIGKSSRPIATVERTYAGTARFDALANALYFVAVGENGAHNLVSVSLADGTVRPITSNELPGFSYASVEVAEEGDLLYLRQESNQDIWTIRFSRP